MAFPEDALGTRIRIAPAADLTEMPDLYDWSDITQDVSFAMSRPIAIKAGAADEQQESNAENTMVLRNFDSRVVDTTGAAISDPALRGKGNGMQGRYSTDNPESDLYPDFDLGIPVEVATDHDGGGYTVQGVMYLGSAEDSWSAGPVPSSNFAITTITLRGLLSRLAQGRDPKSALARTLWGPPGGRPTDYWPMESSGLATLPQTAWPNNNAAGAIASSASAYAGSTTGMVGSDAFPSFTFAGDYTTFAGVHMLTPGSSTGNLTSWRVGSIVGGIMPDGDDHVCAVEARVLTTGGDTQSIRVLMYSQRVAGATVEANSGYDVFVTDGAGSTVLSGSSFGSAINPFDGAPHYLEVEMSQASGTITLNVYIDNVLVITDTVAATLGLFCPRRFDHGTRSHVTFGATTTDNTGLIIFGGHVYYANLSPGTGGGAANVYGGPASLGHTGEMAHQRVVRLCAEEAVPHSVFDEDTRSTVMGPQLVASIVPLLRECEKADYGILDDHMGFVDFVPATYLYNQPTGLTIDGSLGQLKMPFQPVTDDARVLNDCTVTHPGGGPGYRFSDEAHVARVGRYAQGRQLNLYTDSQDANQASWAVHLGTARGKRYPSVSMDFRLSPELIDDWLDPPAPLTSPLGMRVTIVNPPRQHRKGAIETQVRGYVMTLTGRRKWDVVCNTIPYLPWEVFEVETGSGNRSRLDTGGCTLDVGRNTVQTSWSVTSALTRWIDSATYGSMFPFDIEVNGEQITVTAITGTTLTQTMTVTRSVNGVVRSHSAGSVIKLWRPAAIAL